MGFKLGLLQPTIRYDGGTRWGVRTGDRLIECANEADARTTYGHELDRFTDSGGDRPELVVAHIHWQVVN